jgi:raffinose/stachyose/melibiose transport system substrate-binding protein
MQQEENFAMTVRSATPRRAARLLALGGAVALIAAACGSAAPATNAPATAAAATDQAATAAPATEAPTASVNLSGSSFNFLVPVTESGDSPYRAAVDAYMKAFPDRTINLEEIPTDKLGQVERTRFLGGNPPALMYATPGYGSDYSLFPFATAGYLEPLTGTPGAALIPESAMQVYAIDGTVYGQPLDMTLVATVSNQTAMQADGVTWAKDYPGLLEMCKAAAAKDKSVYVVAGSAPPNTGLFSMTVAASRVYADDPDWNAKRAAGEVKFSDADGGWRKALDDIVEMNEAGCFQEGVVAGDFAAITNGLATGSSYSSSIPAGAAFGLAGEAPGNMFVVDPMPGLTEAQTIIFASPNNSLAMASAAPDAEKAAAHAFLDWLAVPENLAMMAAAQQWLPLEPKADQLPPQYAPIASYLEGGKYVPLPNQVWASAEVYDALATGIQGLLSGQTTVDAVLTAMDAAWK